MEIVDRKVYTAIFYEMAVFCFLKCSLPIYLLSGDKPRKRAESLEEIENHYKQSKANVFMLYIGEINERAIQIKVNDQHEHGCLNWEEQK